ncbi:MAG: heme A synthase [Deltaproteobacteria bacterium]|nr:heme A synthase [Deltaproteobacteria bacterium]
MQTLPRSTALAWGVASLVVITSSLVVLGALVRAHGAGLACPDWPLCFGQAIPEFDLKVAFEWSHRVLAGSVGLIFLGLGGAILWQPATRGPAGKLVVLSAVLLAVQVLLGALTVWELLARWSVTSHLLVGNAFNASLLVLALRLSDLGKGKILRPVARGVRQAVWGIAILLLVQLILGGLVSSGYAGLACPEWPTCNGGRWFPSWRGSVGMHLFHRMTGYTLVVALVATAWRVRNVKRVGPLAMLAALLGLTQMLVGIFNVVLGLPVEVTGLHSALAAGLVLTIAAALYGCYNAEPGCETEREHNTEPGGTK